MVRGDELRGVGSEASAADPDLLLPPSTGDVRIAVFEQRAMHLPDRRGVDGVGQLQRGVHGADVSDDQAGVAGGVLAEFGQRDLPRPAAEVLDLRARRTLGAEQNGGERGGDVADLDVETGELGRRVLRQRLQLAAQ